MKRYVPVLIAIGIMLAAALFGYDRITTPAHDQPTPDFALRSFLGVNTLRGEFIVPEGDKIFLVSLLEYKDGKLANKAGSSFGSVEHTAPGPLTAEVLWGKSGDKDWLTLFGPGAAGSQDEDDFWKQLDGGISSIPQGARENHDGYEIIGFAESSLQHDGTKSDVNGGTFTSALAERKYVGALGVRTFKTMDEAENAAHP